MVDEARDVAAHSGVDDRPVGQLEAPDVPLPDVPPFSLEAFLVRDPLAGVVNDSCVLGDRLGGIHAPPVNPRPPPFDHPEYTIHGLRAG
jgi:hypothetical protein